MGLLLRSGRAARRLSRRVGCVRLVAPIATVTKNWRAGSPPESGRKARYNLEYSPASSRPAPPSTPWNGTRRWRSSMSTCARDDLIRNAGILIVDDQEMNLQLLEAILRQAGHSTLECLSDPR